MSNGDLNWIANYIWGIADDVLRDLYVRGKYRDVILPMTVLRRLDAVLEGSKQAVLDMKAALDEAGVVEQDAALRQAAGQAFYNTSRFTLSDLRARANPQQLTADFQAYLDGFSPNVQDILDNFEFRNQIPRLSRADALGTLIEKLTSPDINLSPAPVHHADGSVKHPGLDNHGMGTIFEELVRRFNEENNEEAGEHWTPRDAVRLMAKLVFLPIADQINSGTYLLYDGACGTGGMLTVAEETLRQLAAEHGKEVATHLYGQEINAETYAICKADLLLKGEGEAADNIVGGPEHSTLSNDAFPSREFDFMLSNPPFLPGAEMTRDYLYYVLRAMQPELVRAAPVNTQGNLNVERIGSQAIPCPAIHEQQEIVRHIEERLGKLDAVAKRELRAISTLKEYQTRLFYDAVTGKIDVRSARMRRVGVGFAEIESSDAPNSGAN